MRAIRRGVKTNQAVLSPSSSLLSSSNYVPQSSKGGGGVAGHNGGVCGNSKNNKNSNNINNNNIGATPTTSSSSSNSRHRRSSVKGNKNAPSQQTSVTSTASVAVPKGDSKEGAAPGVPSQQSNKATKALALSRHRSSGCLQSRHCHSTLSLSRARSSSALNRVQSRSMNLLMIQANAGAKTTMSAAGTHNGTMAASNSSMSSNSSVVLVDDEEDEGVATDATTEGQLNNSKDIKSTSTSLTTPTGKQKSSRHARRGQGKAKNKDVGKDSNNTTHGIAQGKHICILSNIKQTQTCSSIGDRT